MYSWPQYRADIQKNWKPVWKSMKSFGKSFRSLEPSKYFEPCLRMTVRLLWFAVQATFFSIRKIANR
jgi:hypothetical protein